jgi:rubrerythrin
MPRVPDTLKTAPPFSELFPIRADVLQAVIHDMQANGFDAAHPIVVWRRPDGDLVIDGHTRLEAALALGLPGVGVVAKEFPDEDAAVKYAIHNQAHRRNLSDSELLKCAAELDKRKKTGPTEESLAQSCAKPSKSADDTAETLNVSTRKVEQIRTVLAHADDETKAAVMSGEKSINAATKKRCPSCGVQMSISDKHAQCKFCRGEKKLAAGPSDKPLTVQPNMPRTDRDDAEPGRGAPKTERIVEHFCSGLMYAEMAISQLERIHPKDEQRQQAFAKVLAWIKAKQ